LKKRADEQNMIPGFIMNNLIINYDAIKPSNTKYLRQFYINNGIDYNIVNNPFGWGETMMVLFNMKKIKEVKRVNPKDNIVKYDLHETREANQYINATIGPLTEGKVKNSQIKPISTITKDNVLPPPPAINKKYFIN
jgi:hypothetical protein